MSTHQETYREKNKAGKRDGDCWRKCSCEEVKKGSPCEEIKNTKETKDCEEVKNCEEIGSCEEIKNYKEFKDWEEVKMKKFAVPAKR